MIILATHKRRAGLERFIGYYIKTKASEPVKLVIDDNDCSYDGMFLPDSFSVLRIPPGASATERANVAFRNFPDEPYYGIMADDVEPLTEHWDIIMKESCGDWNMAYCADGIMNERLATHPFFGGQLIRAQGFIAEPSLHDWYGDNCWMDVTHALGVILYVKGVNFMHHHHLNGKAPMDETYKKQWDHSHDSYLYQQWLHFGGFRKTVNRVSKVMLDKGYTNPVPDTAA